MITTHTRFSSYYNVFLILSIILFCAHPIFAQQVFIDNTTQRGLNSTSIGFINDIAIPTIKYNGTVEVLMAGSTSSAKYRCTAGSPSFLPIQTLPAASASISYVQFDTDTIYEILLDDRMYNYEIGGTWNDANMLLPATMTQSRWSDFNRDGHEDCLATNGDSLIILTNISGKRLNQYLGYLSPGYVEWTDFNNDGYSDILSGNDVLINVQNVFAQQTLLFELPDPVPEGTNPYQIIPKSTCVVDIDNDGDMDIIHVGIHEYRYDYGYGGSHTAYRRDIFSVIYNNNGVLKLGKAIREINNSYTEIDYTISSSDYDNDGMAEILVATQRQVNYGPPAFEVTLKLYEYDTSDSNMVFRQKLDSIVWVGSQSEHIQIKEADIDSDGDLDIFLYGMYSSNNKIKYFMNQTMVSNNAPSPPSTLSSSVNNDEVILSWSAGTDDITAPNALKYILTLKRGSETIQYGYNNVDEKGVKEPNVFNNLSIQLSELLSGNYSWYIQSVDQSDLISARSSIKNFNISNGNIQPFEITNVQGQLHLSYSALDNNYFISFLDNTVPASIQINNQYVNGTFYNEENVIEDNTIAGRNGNEQLDVVRDPYANRDIFTFSDPGAGSFVIFMVDQASPYEYFTLDSNPDSTNRMYVKYNPVLQKPLLVYSLTNTVSKRDTIKACYLDYNFTTQKYALGEIKTLAVLTTEKSAVFDFAINTNNGNMLLSYGYNANGAWSLEEFDTNLNTTNGALVQRFTYGLKSVDLFYDNVQNVYVNTLDYMESYTVNEQKIHLFDGTSFSELKTYQLDLPSRIAILGKTIHGAYHPDRNEYVFVHYNFLDQTVNSQRIEAYTKTALVEDSYVVADINGEVTDICYGNNAKRFLVSAHDISQNKGYLIPYALPKFPVPIISSIDKKKAYSNEIIKITGQNFSYSPWLNTVKFGNVTATIDVSNSNENELTVNVPTQLGRTPVEVSVTFDGQTGVYPNVLFEKIIPPVVNTLSVYEGEANDNLIIYGNNLLADKDQITVRIGETIVPSDLFTLTDTQINLKVPADCPRGTWPVSVTIQNETDTADARFRMIVAPKINDITPATGVTCDVVEIIGQHFADTLTDINVYFGDSLVRKPDMLVVSPDLLYVKVPFGISGPQSIRVETDDRVDVFENETYKVLNGSEIIDSLHTDYATFNDLYEGSPTGILIREVCAVDKILFWHKNSPTSDWLADTLEKSGNLYQFKVPQEYFEDSTAVGYYYQVIDSSGVTFQTSPKSIKVQMVKNIAPLLGEPGDTVVIQGQNLPTNYISTNIRLGEYKLSEQDILWDVSNDSRIVFRVPSLQMGAHPFDIVLRNQPINYDAVFDLMVVPELTEIKPLTGTSCDSVVIRGAYFTGSGDLVQVAFGSKVLGLNDMQYISSDTLIVYPPAGVYGEVSVSIKVRDHLLTYPNLFTITRGDDVLASGIEEKRYASSSSHFGDKYIDEIDEFNPVTAWVQVRSMCTIKNIAYLVKGSQANQWTSVGKMSPVEDKNRFEIELEVGEVKDPIGYELACITLDELDNRDTTHLGWVFKNVVDIDSTEFLSNKINFGTSMSNYHIISFPYEYDVPKVSLVLQDLYDKYGYNIKKWRFYTFDEEDQKTIEYDDFDEVALGEAYWLIAKHEQPINIAGGTTADISSGPFSYPLKSGWNMIGNPYAFDVPWSHILEANPDIADQLHTPKTYENGSLKETTSLKAFGGMFLYWEGEANASLAIPYASSSSGGRMASDFDGWSVNFTLVNNGVKNELHAIGMADGATDAFDKYDDKQVPVVVDVPSLSIGDGLSRDIRSMKDGEEWNIENNSKSTLNWFVKNEQQLNNNRLVLIDHDRIVDMTVQPHYTSDHTAFKILYGTPEFINDNLSKDRILFGEPYPNPFSQLIQIPFLSKEPVLQSEVFVYTSSGQLVKEVYNSSNHNTMLVIDDLNKLEKGIYLLKIHLKTATSEHNNILKVVRE